MIRRRALGVAALAVCLGCDPYEPRTTGMLVRYTPQVPAGLPDPAAVGCTHHYAPVNMAVSTSWGASARLMPAPGGGGLTAHFEADRGGDYWLSIVDINFCGAVPPATPSPASGVTINDVVLTRTAIEGDKRVFLFTVTKGGVILP